MNALLCVTWQMNAIDPSTMMDHQNQFVLFNGGEDAEIAIDALTQVAQENDLVVNQIDCEEYSDFCSHYKLPSIVLPYRHLLHQLLPPETFDPEEIERFYKETLAPIARIFKTVDDAKQFFFVQNQLPYFYMIRAPTIAEFEQLALHVKDYLFLKAAFVQAENDEIEISVYRQVRQNNTSNSATYVTIQYNGDFSSQSLERFVVGQETKPMQQINATILEGLSEKNPVIVLLYDRSSPENVHAYNTMLRYLAKNLNDSTIQQWRFLTCEYGSEEAKTIIPMFGLTDNGQQHEAYLTIIKGQLVNIFDQDSISDLKGFLSEIDEGKR